MKFNKELKKEYQNKKPFGYYAFTAWVEFYAIDILYDCDDFMVIKESSNDKLHCLKVYCDTERPYINYYGYRVHLDEIYRY